MKIGHITMGSTCALGSVILIPCRLIYPSFIYYSWWFIIYRQDISMQNLVCFILLIFCIYCLD
ncbi:hypothetical protein SLEP1_g36977 [Rubroshorea leprosula]|uniref:Uncharacterized protein n=1 Tax=Rubroshorea leprosula TaxID=152421 RepID=A0AAV5KTD5_9ROSI|nr:hypothetical protein SLEP1_g36977 [Rubroshorea leprosula]